MTQTNTVHPDLKDLLATHGPFASLYLDTLAATETGPESIQLRWRAMRDKAAGSGASEGALRALDQIVEGSHLKGDGLVAFAAADGVPYRRFLRREIDDVVTFGALPHLLPLLEWRQDNPHHAVVIADRGGAEIHVIGEYGDEEEEIIVTGGDEPISQHAKGGWRAQRFQRRIEVAWETNAKDVADELIRVVKKHRPELVLMTGDVRAVGFLRDHLPQEVDPLFHQLEGTPDPHTFDEIHDRIQNALTAHMARSTETLLQKFQEERGQRDLAAEGIEPTLSALRMSQVETLLISRRPPQGTAWFARADVAQAALKRDELDALAVSDIQESHLDDVLVGAAIATGARVWVIPDLDEKHAPREGIGALLRFATT